MIDYSKEEREEFDEFITDGSCKDLVMNSVNLTEMIIEDYLKQKELENDE